MLRLKPPTQIAVAIITSLLFLGIRFAIDPYVIGVPYITFFPAISLIACVCSFRIGLICALIFSFWANYFFIPPGDNPVLFNQNPLAIASTIVFIFFSIFIIFIAEITKREIRLRKKAEEELQNYANELKKTNQSLKQSNQQLEQFAYAASHDLQEPIRIVAMYVDLLNLRYGKNLDEQAQGFLNYISDGAKQAQALVRDLLEYSCLGNKKDFAKIDMNAVMSKVKEQLKVMLNENGADLTIDLLPSVTADPFQMVQLFQNILSNACKYKSDKPLKIHVFGEETPDSWFISVKDNGIGVDPKYHELIFKLFKRLHSKKDYAGTGVGLAICSKIMEQHQGSIRIESEEGKGAVFIIQLPKNRN